MNESGFKLYKPIEYCESSATFKKLAQAVFGAWGVFYEGRRGYGQMYAPRLDFITPQTTIEDILLHASMKKDRNYFLERLVHAINFSLDVSISVFTPELTKLTMFDICKLFNWLNNKKGRD